MDKAQTCKNWEVFSRNEIQRLEDGPKCMYFFHDELSVHFVNIPVAILVSAVVQQSWRISHHRDSHSFLVREHTMVLNQHFTSEINLTRIIKKKKGFFVRYVHNPMAFVAYFNHRTFNLSPTDYHFLHIQTVTRQGPYPKTRTIDGVRRFFYADKFPMLLYCISE